MAVNYNPSIVTSGLVLCLDAGNIKSYPAKNFISAKIYSVFGGALRSSNYTVQYSDDNSNWVTAFSGIASNNTSCGIQQNTGFSTGSYGFHRYWRYVEGSAISGHHPRVSRIILTDINGSDNDLIVYTSDNCLDSGTYIVGTVSKDFGGTAWNDLSISGLNASGTAANISSTGAIAGASWNTASTSILNTDSHSIFFMLKLNSSVTYPQGYTGGYQKMFSYNAGGDRSPSVWLFPSARGLHWRYNPGNTSADFYSDSLGTEFALNTWYYVGVTKNGSTALSYVNGINVISSTVANPKTAGSAAVIINENAINPLNNINSLMIYDRTLTASEISKNFNALRGRYGI